MSSLACQRSHLHAWERVILGLVPPEAVAPAVRREARVALGLRRSQTLREGLAALSVEERVEWGMRLGAGSAARRGEVLRAFAATLDAQREGLEVAVLEAGLKQGFTSKRCEGPKVAALVRDHVRAATALLEESKRESRALARADPGAQALMLGVALRAVFRTGVTERKGALEGVTGSEVALGPWLAARLEKRSSLRAFLAALRRNQGSLGPEAVPPCWAPVFLWAQGCFPVFDALGDGAGRRAVRGPLSALAFEPVPGAARVVRDLEAFAARGVPAAGSERARSELVQPVWEVRGPRIMLALGVEEGDPARVAARWQSVVEVLRRLERVTRDC